MSIIYNLKINIQRQSSVCFSIVNNMYIYLLGRKENIIYNKYKL